MAFLFLFVLPALLVNLTAYALTRRRESPGFLAYRAMAAGAVNVLLSLVWLIPQDRMNCFAADGRLGLTMGKSAALVCLAASVALGVGFALLVKEDAKEDVKEEKAQRVSKGKGGLLGILAHALLLVLLILTQACIWGRMVYPNITFEEIIFHMHMPLEGTAQSFAQSAVHSVFLPALICFAAMETACWGSGKRAYVLAVSRRIRFRLYPVNRLKKLRWVILFLWFGMVVLIGDRMLDIAGYLRGYLDRSSFIEEHYADPRETEMVFPAKKRNLITIYLESMESTVQDTASGGLLEQNFIPELTRLAQENTSFSHSEKLEGARVAPACDWTIAGLVAQTAGVPFKLHGTRGDMHEAFLPGVYSLGDILSRQGYRTMFMAGSDFSFGGRRAYYTQHGGYEVYDLLTARQNGKVPEDYNVFWGFEDFRLYEYAKEELTALHASGEPFHFSMLTVDTHNPGYRCPLCPADNLNTGRDVLNYVDVLRCASMQLEAFIAWCQEQPFFENTTIVVTGDHESMQSFFFENLVGAEGKRYVYNVFINPAQEPVQEKNRRFTTMDFFPTALGSIGVQIQGGRLGLGTDLFSGQATLSETYGEEYLFDELSKHSTFYDEVLLYP